MKRKLLLVSVVLLVVAVLINVQIIKKKQNKKIPSIISEWNELGKPVEVMKLKKTTVPLYVKVSGIYKDNTMQALVSLGTKNKIKGGEDAIIKFSGKKIKATVQDISTSPENNTGLYKVKIVLNNGFKIPENSIIVANIIRSWTTPVIAVPNEALIREKNKTFIWILKDKTAYRKNIETGRTNGIYTEIVSGIDEGPLFIVKGKEMLKENDTVRIYKNLNGEQQ